jgi:hypothetical protein
LRRAVRAGVADSLINTGLQAVSESDSTPKPFKPGFYDRTKLLRMAAKILFER